MIDRRTLLLDLRAQIEVLQESMEYFAPEVQQDARCRIAEAQLILDDLETADRLRSAESGKVGES